MFFAPFLPPFIPKKRAECLTYTTTFDLISSDIIFKEIASLDTKKARHSNDLPTKTVKANADLFSIFASNAFNESAILCKFLSVLKLADIKPVHKKHQGLN